MARHLSPVVKRACKVASVNTNIPHVVTEEVIYLYYKMIADCMRKAEKGNPNTFSNFNLPGVGKLFCNPERVLKLQKMADDSKANIKN